MDETSSAWSLDNAVAYGRGLLRGQRVTLRESREEDFERLAKWWADPSIAVLQSDYLRPTPAPTTSDLMRGWGANIGSDCGFTIELTPNDDSEGQPTDSGRVIGQISLFGVTKNRCGTLGVVVGKQYWGNGLGTEAVRLMVRYGFVEMGLHRIQLGVYSYNDRAIRSYASSGFKEEGRRSESSYHGGTWHDEILMAILENEWWARNR